MDARVRQAKHALPDQHGVVDDVTGSDDEAWDAEKEFLQALAMRWAVAAIAAGRHAQNDWAAALRLVKALELSGVVGDLVKGKGDEVAEHDLDDRPIAAYGKAVRNANDSGLGNRRGEHAVGKTGGKAAIDLKGPAIGIENVFAEQIDV